MFMITIIEIANDKDKRNKDFSKLFGYEFKWGVSKKSKNEKSWLNSYPTEAIFEQVNRDNYLDFIV